MTSEMEKDIVGIGELQCQLLSSVSLTTLILWRSTI